MLQLACSSNPAILSALPFHEYKSISPAFPLRGLKQSFVIDRSNLNLKSAKAYAELVKLVDNKDALPWQKNMVKDADGGLEPNYVQIVLPEPQRYGSLPAFAVGPDVLQEVGDNQPEQQPYFKVDWRGDKIIKLGDHSVIFGFTSNLPPTEDLVRIVSSTKDGIKKARRRWARVQKRRKTWQQRKSNGSIRFRKKIRN